MVDSIKITALQDIGANIAYTTLVPVVNMSGTPTTQKSNLQNLGNLILNGAGGSYFPRAAQATLALSVANAAQPNITSVGTLTSLTVSGNITAGNINGGNLVVANYFSGDGGFLSNISGSYSNSNVANYLPNYAGNVGANWLIADYVSGNANPLFHIPQGNLAGVDGNGGNVLYGNGVFAAAPGGGSSYGNSNVATYLPTYTGNVGANTITSTSNLTIQTDTGNANVKWVFGSGGALYWPSAPGAEWAIEPNGSNEFEIHSHTNVVISTDTSNANYHFTFDTDGSLSFPTNNLYINGDTSLFGSNTAIIQTGSNVPLALITQGANSSLDSVWISNLANVGNSKIAAVYVNPSASRGNIRVVTGNNASNVYIWDFDNTGNLSAPGYLNFSNGSRALLAYGANNYINLNNDGGMDLSCNTEVKITTNYGDAPNRAYSYFYANGTFSTGTIVATGNITGGNIIKSNVIDYANLPAATTAGLRSFISDANLVAAGNFGATVGSGGSNTVPVYSDGSNWRIG